MLEVLAAERGRVEGLDAEAAQVLHRPRPQLEHVEPRELAARLDHQHRVAEQRQLGMVLCGTVFAAWRGAADERMWMSTPCKGQARRAQSAHRHLEA